MKNRKELPAEVLNGIKNAEESLTLYAYREFLDYVGREGLPKMAEMSNKTFAIFTKIERIAAKENIQVFGDIQWVIINIRGFKQMVNDLQEISEPDCVVMRSSNADFEVNISGLLYFINEMEQIEDISYYFQEGQPILMQFIDRFDVKECQEIYYWMEELKGLFACL